MRQQKSIKIYFEKENHRNYGKIQKKNTLELSINLVYTHSRAHVINAIEMLDKREKGENTKCILYV